MNMCLPIAFDGDVTDMNIYEYSSQWRNSVIAHNYGEGYYYYNIEIGDEIIVHTEEGIFQYTVTNIEEYETLDWQEHYFYMIGFVNDIYSKDQNRIYLQTCNCDDTGVVVITLEERTDFGRSIQ